MSCTISSHSLILYIKLRSLSMLLHTSQWYLSRYLHCGVRLHATICVLCILALVLHMVIMISVLHADPRQAALHEPLRHPVRPQQDQGPAACLEAFCARVDGAGCWHKRVGCI